MRHIVAKYKPVVSDAVDFSSAFSLVSQTQRALVKAGKSMQASAFLLSALETNTVDEICKLASTYVSFFNESNSEEEFSHLETYRQNIRIEYLDVNDDEDDVDDDEDDDDDDDNGGDILKS